MANRTKALIAATLVCGVVAIVVVRAQQKRVWSLGHLTPVDYIEIQQLVAHYPYALDRGTDHGRVYAALFTPDGVFQGNGKYAKGREELAKSADRGDDAPQNVGHFMMNHVIEPGANGGAVGKQYLLTISAFGPEVNGRRAVSIRKWHYEDIYEKTSEGWLFKSRTLIEKPEPPSPPAPPATPSR